MVTTVEVLEAFWLFWMYFLKMFSEAEEPVAEGEKIVDAEKPAAEETVGDATKDSPVDEPEEKEKEPEDKVITYTGG